MDPISAYLIRILAPVAGEIARQLLAELIADLPLLVLNVHTANTTVVTEAPAAPKDFQDAANQELKDAISSIASGSH